MSGGIDAGFVLLQGNRLELLMQAVDSWLLAHPLDALEPEQILVQSNGMAEWLKMSLATRAGICAAAKVELPARFLWRSFRQVLGAAAVPSSAPLDKPALVWRLMQLLPEVAGRSGFAPLASLVQGDNMQRRLQLAQRLADLFDQYQVYRGDWLDAWVAGHDRLPRFAGDLDAPTLGADQHWQAALWRVMIESLPAEQRHATRPGLHQRFIAALARGPRPVQLPRRIVVFGMVHLPTQVLSALAALSRHCQVLLAVPNPCRFHWADTIDGRELLRLQQRHQPLRGGQDLAAVALHDMHAHAHPLLAAWGRQGRDFVRQLDAFDAAAVSARQPPMSRVDLFDDAPAHTLLQQVHARIRDLVPLDEHAALAPAGPGAADRSIVFHIAHGVQREVEILHDQLLQLLADAPPDEPLNPRDVVVMVPDIQVFAPAIRSVFGQYERHDARFIPFDITDLRQRGDDPLLIALEWLLGASQRRCTASELRDLLDVPAVATRFALDSADLPRLALWIEGAGIRWGLDASHRSGLGLGECHDLNTWQFGLRRMLLGYAVGEGGAVQNIEPYGEIGGLDATLVGSLSMLIDALRHWTLLSQELSTPRQWAARFNTLVDQFFAPTGDADRLTLAALRAALSDWLAACESAGFDAPVDLAVAREAWLSQFDLPGARQRFRAGGVTFCTLLPMRAIPFEVVCLLGMNDGDYPRPAHRADFDLMGLPGQTRPGDRSRRADDRQLMLEAVLSARRALYISWAGRSQRDNSEQPPSVLVSQLRDYLRAGWGDGVLAPRTTEHPLQPFSRRYFQRGSTRQDGEAGLFTHAREWRQAHEPVLTARPSSMPHADIDTALDLKALARFLKQPVREYFGRRLQVHFDAGDNSAGDDESFALEGLDRYRVIEEGIERLAAHPENLAEGQDLGAMVEQQVARARRAGQLPMASVGRHAEIELLATLVPMLAQWRELRALYPYGIEPLPLRHEHAGLGIDDVLLGLR
ncbi:MAG: exodeoxyribonuclease V subunit gamma, partial [Rubrivivax sp.]